MKKIFFAVFFFIGCGLAADDSILRWAADTDSGAPNVFYADEKLSELVGFEKDIIERVAELIGRKAVFYQNDYDVLIPGLQRDLYDVVINGMIPDAVTGDGVLFSEPYYACGLALVVRSDDDKIMSVLDCNGAVVGVLRNAKSEAILVNNLKKIKPTGYPNEYCAISDLKDRRVDAVLLDWQIATYYVGKIGNLKIVDEVGESRYSIVVIDKNRQLMNEINGAIATMKRDGTLEKIISKWNLHNLNCQKLLSAAGMGTLSPAAGNENSKISKPYTKYIETLPLFLKAACITLMLSILGMGVAIVLGLCLAITRLYAPKWIGFIAISIIEFLRGTPLVIQLFFVFYGLPRIGITLSPIVAGVFTLGINYSSYEAENFRAGMFSVPHGQMEAARALGMSQWQSLRHVILPQAFTFILPPLTNDFIALLKDSSLVSLITIVELTKTYSLAASTTLDFFGFGVMVAIIYFIIGLPFVRLARLAEYRLRLEKRAYSARKAKKT
ncbi:MAG: ABC transporter substrate-binding protein/permease [Puniceicoccales bacterium]|jgi:polar amino acid transport system substrate-binding protein|nr:ABC transporter substrate-binding protein/permease [Puniceicoccales bacterium]